MEVFSWIAVVLGHHQNALGLVCKALWVDAQSMSILLSPVSCLPPPPQSRLEQLGFNALLQLMIGVPLEMVHGVLRIGFLYLAGVLAGEVGSGEPPSPEVRVEGSALS